MLSTCTTYLLLGRLAGVDTKVRVTQCLLNHAERVRALQHKEKDTSRPDER